MKKTAPKMTIDEIIKNAININISFSVTCVFHSIKKSARFARTFSSRASRAARFARKNERAWGAQPNGRRASRYALSVAGFPARSILV